MVSYSLLSLVAPPEITVEKSWVHAGEGYETQLVCTVHGEANPVVRLFTFCRLCLKVFFFYWIFFLFRRARRGKILGFIVAYI